MKVLVTGAAGFIGSHLVRLLIAGGHDVTAVISPATKTWRIADVLDRLRIVPCDVGDRDYLGRLFASEPPDVCIHLAWRGWSGPSLTAEDNLSSLASSLELLRTMADVRCRRFVGIGTCFEYEARGDALSETTPVRPRDLYGICKGALSAAAAELARIADIEIAWARVFLVYGPHDDERRLVPAVTLSLLRGQIARTTPGEQLRDFLHVEDAAAAIWAVARSSYVGPVNVASGQSVMVREVVKQVAALVGRPDLLQVGAMPYRAGEPKMLVADASLLTRQIGWQPRYDLNAGLADTVEWWRNRDSRPGAVAEFPHAY